MSEELSFKGDEAAETTGGGGGGNFTAAPRGVYWLQIVEAKLTKTGPNAKNPGVPMLQFVLEVADDDARDALGKKVWHNVTLIPRGNGEKAAGGHGIAVHWFKATKMRMDGKPFKIEDFLEQDHSMVQGFLEEDSYTKGQYTNASNKLVQVYTDTHPAPTSEAEWPEPPKKKAAPAAGAQRSQAEMDEVPF